MRNVYDGRKKNLILRRREAPSRRTRIVIQPLAGTAKSLLLIRFGQHFGEQRALDIAAGLDQRDPFAGEAPAFLQGRGERCGGGTLGEVARIHEHSPRGVP
jgi:hypothetical protein